LATELINKNLSSGQQHTPNNLPTNFLLRKDSLIP
jgi:hypothetical protein